MSVANRAVVLFCIAFAVSAVGWSGVPGFGVEVLSEAPAKLYGAFPRKGHIAEGADADIVVYDPNGESVITAADQVANVDYAPYEGTKIAGHIAQVWLRGKLSVEEGTVLADRGGIYIPRKKSSL